MTFRTKILLLIVALISVVVIATIGTSLHFMRSGIERTISSDLKMIRELANELVSSEINLIKSKAVASANRLKNTPMDRWNAIIKEEVDSSDIFKAITIFERNGLVVAGYGDPQTPPDLLFSDLSKRVFNGASIISTTYRAPNGDLVFYVGVPLAQMILSATISGMYFTEMLEKFRIWQTGSLFIVDDEGTIIANRRHFLVLNRYNSLRDPNQDPDTLSLQTFIRRMLRNHDGEGRYAVDGSERIGVFAHISASNSGWILAASAPLEESPAAFIDKVLMAMTFVFLALGTLLAYFASAFVDKQFKTINEQNDNLTRLSAIAHSTSEAKSNFLAIMSHEMRTPLNAIIGFSELILHGRASPSGQGGEMMKIHQAGVTLLSLVNDILDISKIESGKLELISVDYNLASVINDTVTVNLPRAEGKPVEFALDVDKDLPSRLRGDDLRVKQIINNLLSNAFKYTMAGEVVLSMTGWPDGEDYRLSVKVSDTGVGIREEDLAKLFADYSQVDTRGNRSIEGTGLGLSISKKLVDLMDGTIEVESRHGLGSTFTATIRQGFVSSEPIGESVAGRLKSLRRGRLWDRLAENIQITPMPYASVLVVDDVQANLDVARGALRPYQVQVDCATSGRQAVEMVRDGKTRYDAIFMDHMMPGMDGVEAAKAIRALGGERASGVPIIALTANAIVGSEQMFLNNGFQGFIPKPIDLERLDAVMRRFVQGRGREGAPPSAKKAGRAALGQLPAATGDGPSAPQEPKFPNQAGAPKAPPGAYWVDDIDLVEGLSRFAGDRRAYFEVLRSYRDSVSDIIGQLRDPGPESLKHYTIVIHGLKSSSYGVCAKRIGKLAEELELKAAMGDLDYVLKNNSDFLTAVDKMMGSLEAFFDTVGEKLGPKPVKESPDPVALARLRKACQAYDMDGVDSAIQELDVYSYPGDPHLTSWLKDRAEVLDFQGILERIPAA